MKADNLDPNTTYVERDLLTLGFDRKFLTELRADLSRYKIQSVEILGAWVLNYILRNGGDIGDNRYVNAFNFSESTGLPYSDVLRRQHNKRPLSVQIGLNGASDMMIDVKDTHLFYEEVEDRDAFTKAVIEYQDRRTRESLERVFEQPNLLWKELLDIGLKN